MENLYMIIAIVVIGFIIIALFIGLHNKYMCKPQKKEEKKTIFSSSWMKDEDLQKNIYIQKNDAPCNYPAFCVDGLTQKDSKQILTLDILAEDRKSLKKRGCNIPGLDEKACGSSLVVGGAGSYKTANIVKPTIIKNLTAPVKPSMVVTDPKGELFEDISGLCLSKGYCVYRFNPTNFKHSNSWNMLDNVFETYQKMLVCTNVVDKAQYKSMIDGEVSTIVDIISPVPADGGQNTYFYQAAQLMIKGYILMFLEQGMSKENFNMGNIAYNIRILNKKAYILMDTLDESSMSFKYLNELKESMVAQGQGDAGLQSVISTANNSMGIFLNENIKNITSKSNIDFNKFATGKVIVFVNVETSSSAQSEANRIAVLFMQMLYASLNKYLSNNAISALKVPCLYIIDEFGNLPKMPFIPKIFSLDRGKNIFALTIIQSKSQVSGIYGEFTTKELIDSANAIIVCSITDVDFAEELSRASGSNVKKVKNESESKQKGADGKDIKSTSTSENEQKFVNVNAEDFINKKKNEYIICLQNKQPYKMTFMPYWETAQGKSVGKFSPMEIVVSEISAKDVNFFDSEFSQDKKTEWAELNKDNQNPTIQDLVCKITGNIQPSQVVEPTDEEKQKQLIEEDQAWIASILNKKEEDQ